MKHTLLLKRYGLLAALAVLSLGSCKKGNNNSNNNSGISDDEKGYGADQAKLEQENNDVLSIADIAEKSGGSNLRSAGMNELSGCATVTHDTVLNIITIDFGTTPCTGIDGRNRSGKIIVNYTGQYKDAGSVHTISFDNYVINGNQLTGSKTVTNQGTNNNGDHYYSVTVSDTLWAGTVTSNNGFRSWTGNRIRTWVSGYSTNTRADDAYDISGTTTIRRINGNTFTANITSPLRVSAGCAWISQGTIEITSQNNNNTRVMDYGNGNCDSQATLTINGTTYNITL